MRIVSSLVCASLLATAIATLHGENTSGSLVPSSKRATLPSGWKLGAACISDASDPYRLLSWSDTPASLTITSCLNECAFHGFIYAGLQFGEQCWCGNNLDTAGGAGAVLPTSSCNSPCNGDTTTMCGGSWAISLYNRTLSASPYSKATIHAGSSFFTGWSFFTDKDPTGGNVTYVSKSTATSKNLAYVRSDGVAVLKVDNTTTLSPGQNRQSVRISTTTTYTTALMIFDVLNMPWGCSVWPAIWTVGPDWPNNGEIDIIEGVNDISNNQMTWHTGPTTSCNTSAIQNNWVTTGFGDRVCASSPASDAGCGFFESNDPAVGTYGQGLNANGGGVYALQLSSAGGKIWRWTHSQIPSDIKSGHAPKPDGWGIPAAMLLSDSSCPTQKLIQQQSIVIDTTICGGWCAQTYSGLGCGADCTERIPNPRNYDNAYWLIKNITIWQ